MAVGDEESPLVTELKGLFGSTCNGVKLSTALVLALVSYFIAVVKMTDVEEVPKDAVDEMEEAATEAWMTAHSMDLPKSLALRVRAGRTGVCSLAPPSAVSREPCVLSCVVCSRQLEAPCPCM